MRVVPPKNRAVPKGAFGRLPSRWANMARRWTRHQEWVSPTLPSADRLALGPASLTSGDGAPPRRVCPQRPAASTGSSLRARWAEGLCRSRILRKRGDGSLHRPEQTVTASARSIWRLPARRTSARKASLRALRHMHKVPLAEPCAARQGRTSSQPSQIFRSPPSAAPVASAAGGGVARSSTSLGLSGGRLVGVEAKRR